MNPWYPKAHFKFSHLCYALIKQPQYEATVKLLGSFRLTAGNRHLHRYCIFTEQVLETVSQSLRLSCTSELTRQGIALFYSFLLQQEGLYLHHLYKEIGCVAFGLYVATYGLKHIFRYAR